jgi:cysteinyl-tRNA synthetase
MSRALLGVPFDLHGGGFDLIFPHHENEIAQSEALMDAPPMARTWVHGGLLNFEGRKMSKSLGNFEPLADLLKRHDPLAIRLLFLQTGYRKPMNFTEDSIQGVKRQLRRMQLGVAKILAAAGDERLDAAAAYSRLAEHGGAGAAVTAIFDALDDDMDTARAVGFLSGLTREREESIPPAVTLAIVRDIAETLGLGPAFDDAALRAAERDEGADRSALPADIVERLRSRLDEVLHLNGATAEDAIEAIIAKRAEARKNRDFALGDRLRDALLAEGIALKDSKDGTTWTLAGA